MSGSLSLAFTLYLFRLVKFIGSNGSLETSSCLFRFGTAVKNWLSKSTKVSFISCWLWSSIMIRVCDPFTLAMDGILTSPYLIRGSLRWELFILPSLSIDLLKGRLTGDCLTGFVRSKTCYLQTFGCTIVVLSNFAMTRCFCFYWSE